MLKDYTKIQENNPQRYNNVVKKFTKKNLTDKIMVKQKRTLNINKIYISGNQS